MKIRKFTVLLIAVIWVVTSVLYSPQAFADTKDKIVLTVGSPYMYVNGTKKEVDPGKGTSPQAIGGNIYTPTGAVLKEMGGNAVWTAKEKKLDITLGAKALKLWIDKNYAMVNGKKIAMTAPPKLVKGQPMVPVKFLADQLGAAMSLDKTKKTVTLSFVKPKEEAGEDNWKYLVINDNEIDREDVVIREKSGDSYIFVNAETFKYAFKYPTLSNPYPNFYREENTFVATWKENDDTSLEIIMEIDNPTFAVNGQAADAGMGPIKIGEAYYIPINFFIEALGMNVTYDKDVNSILVQFKSNFPKSTLVGYWSDIDTNLFTEFVDPSSGAKSLSSFANAYIYKADGTYMLRMIAVGGFTDTFIEQKGKYKIVGYVVIHYDISETVYKGTPFALQYKNKKLDKPQYSFIDNYYPDENRIVFNQIPVTKREQ